MRVKAFAVTLGLAIAVAAVVGAVLLDHGRRERAAAHEVSRGVRPAPTGALSAVRLLVSGQGREALAPALAAVLPAGRPFPAGTTFTQARGWQQTGDFASLTGILREPGIAPATAEIGLIKRGGKWLVTFEAAR